MLSVGVTLGRSNATLVACDGIASVPVIIAGRFGELGRTYLIGLNMPSSNPRGECDTVCGEAFRPWRRVKSGAGGSIVSSLSVECSVTQDSTGSRPDALVGKREYCVFDGLRVTADISGLGIGDGCAFARGGRAMVGC